MAATCSRRWRGGLTSRAGDRHSGEGRPAGAQGGNPREPARDRGAASAGRLRHRALGAQAQRRPGRGDRSAGGRQAYRVASVDDASSQEPRGRPSNRGLVSGAARTIEQVVQVMKSQGFDLEESQIGTPEAMAKLALAVLIAALRIMQLVNARSVTTGQKLADAMGEAAGPLVEILTRKLEGKTVKLKNPHPEVRARAPGVGRRPAGRLRRLYRARLQASRTHHNDQRPRPLRRHPRRMGDPPKSVNPLGRRPRLAALIERGCNLPRQTESNLVEHVAFGSNRDRHCDPRALGPGGKIPWGWMASVLGQTGVAHPPPWRRPMPVDRSFAETAAIRTQPGAIFVGLESVVRPGLSLRCRRGPAEAALGV